MAASAGRRQLPPENMLRSSGSRLRQSPADRRSRPGCPAVAMPPNSPRWLAVLAGKADGRSGRKVSRSRQARPNSENAWNGLGWACFNAGNLPEAEQAFQTVVALNPNHPGALNGLGQIYSIQRKYDLAETNPLKAAPNAPAAWWGLTKLYLLQGKFRAGRKMGSKDRGFRRSQRRRPPTARSGQEEASQR